MAGLCEGGNESAGSLKAISHLNAIDLARDRTRNLGHRRPALYQLANHVDSGFDVPSYCMSGYLASERYEGDNAGEMSPGSSTESYPAFARIGLRENPGKNLNQVTCPDRDSNPGHLVSQPDALTVTPQLMLTIIIKSSVTSQSKTRKTPGSSHTDEQVTRAGALEPCCIEARSDIRGGPRVWLRARSFDRLLVCPEPIRHICLPVIGRRCRYEHPQTSNNTTT
ncbi:hypothetical protein ANN_20959 [Periplaneta americana]|uniref:Uncharacterized protein n=1 Tax=Periplaneta americana TaxID=6978 RepID=A0ABQ8SE69_PERAM|nr:hypothetical protein ANN_20959 [Periplaneta americana]